MTVTPDRRLVLAGLAAFVATPALAAPASRLIDPMWRATGAGGDPDAGPWARFLSAYRRMGGDGVARVAYGSVSGADRGALKGWIGAMERVDPAALSAPAQMAYWINLYNAKTVDLVLDAYPVETIKSIMGGFFGNGPWDEKVLTVKGRPLSLNDIEHGILRPIWNDPRIHYAVNCASIGCPDLAAVPFSSGGLQGQLDGASSGYINHPRGAEISGGALTVSSIFEWYKSDFGGTDAGVINHLRRYAAGGLAQGLAGVSSIARDRYDWSLNRA